MNKHLKELLSKRKRIIESLSRLNDSIHTIHIETKIPCAKCGKKITFVDMELYRINWRGIVAEYQYICNCKYVNRLLSKCTTGEYRDYLRGVEKYVDGCRSVQDIHHDENEPAKKYKFVNNFYMEDLINEEKDFENE